VREKKYFIYSKDLFDEENIDYDNIFPQIMKEGKDKRAHLEDFFREDGATKIPLISHHVYVSYSTQTPVAMNNIQTKHSIATVNALNSVANFQHYFWTNNPDIIPNEIKQLSGMEMHLISELKNFRLYQEIEELLDDPNQDILTLIRISDIVRILAGKKFGGVYCDADYMIYNPELLLSFLKAFDFIAGMEADIKYYAIGNAFFASTPNHLILNEASKILERNIYQEKAELIPNYIKYPYCLFSKAIYETGPIMFTMSFFKVYNQGDYNNVLLPKYFLFNQGYLLANTPESDCHNHVGKQQSLVNYYDGEMIETIGADPLCGGWSGWGDPTHPNQIPIKY
jgi:hypothetical protein